MSAGSRLGRLAVFHHAPTVRTGFKHQAGRSPIGTRTPAGPGIEHPGPGAAITHEPVAVSVYHRTGVGIAASQPRMALRRPTGPMSVHHHQMPARQLDIRFLGEHAQYVVVPVAPVRVVIVVTAHRKNRRSRSFQRFKHGGAANVSGMNDEVAGMHPRGDARVQIAVAVGHQADSYPFGHGHKIAAFAPPITVSQAPHTAIAACSGKALFGTGGIGFGI